MTELALVPFITLPSFEERAQNSLRVNTERDFLDLHGLEQSRLFPLPLLLLYFSLFSRGFLLLFLQSRTRLAC